MVKVEEIRRNVNVQEYKEIRRKINVDELIKEEERWI